MDDRYCKMRDKSSGSNYTIGAVVIFALAICFNFFWKASFPVPFEIVYIIAFVLIVLYVIGIFFLFKTLICLKV